MSDKMYDTAYIYKISGGGLTYYGSTKDPRKREIGHRTAFKNFSNGNKKRYISSAEVYRTGEAVFEIIETVHNISKFHLQRLERQYILENTCVNRYKPQTLSEEKKDNKRVYDKAYTAQYKAYIQTRKQKYREDNLEDIKRKQKEIIQCDICGNNYTRSNKSYHMKSKKHLKAQAAPIININITNSNNNKISF